MKRSPILYPGTEYVYQGPTHYGKLHDDKPDWKYDAPDYEDKFKNWKPEEVLAWLNID